MGNNTLKPILQVSLWNGGFCKMYDFSKTNANKENRIEAVCKVASKQTSEEYYRKLYASCSSFGRGGLETALEFVPVFKVIQNNDFRYDTQLKFGISTNKTSYSAIVKSNVRIMLADYCNYYNESVDGFFVFKIRIPEFLIKYISEYTTLSYLRTEEKDAGYYYCSEFTPVIKLEADWFNKINPDGVIYSKDQYAEMWQKHVAKSS